MGLSFAKGGRPLQFSAELRAFAFREPAPFARFQVAEAQLADGDADEAEDGESDGGSHAANLAVASFSEGDLYPGGRDGLAKANGRVARGELGLDVFEEANLGGASTVVLDLKSHSEPLEGTLVGDSFDLCPVSSGMGEFRIREKVLEPAVAG